MLPRRRYHAAQRAFEVWSRVRGRRPAHTRVWDLEVRHSKAISAHETLRCSEPSRDLRRDDVVWNRRKQNQQSPWSPANASGIYATQVLLNAISNCCCRGTVAQQRANVIGRHRHAESLVASAASPKRSPVAAACTSKLPHPTLPQPLGIYHLAHPPTYSRRAPRRLAQHVARHVRRPGEGPPAASTQLMGAPRQYVTCSS